MRVVIATATGAGLRPAAASGARGEPATATGAAPREPPDPPGVPEPPEPPDPPEAVATGLTEETFPGVLAPSGSVMLTRSPALTPVCCSASRLTVTTGVVEVAGSTVAAGPAPPPRAGRAP